MPDLLGFGKGFKLLNYVNKRQPEKQNRLVLSQTIFCWIDWLSGCLIHHKRLMLLLSPLRPAERSILFSGKSVRLSDSARSATSSYAPKKGCGVREVWRSQTCTSGSPFFCLLFFGEAKKSKCLVGMRRMVKATLEEANHKAATLFQAAFGVPTNTSTHPNNLHPTICGLLSACITILNTFHTWQLSGCLNYL